ncbi:MAG TPA: ribbon-helix-helix protein, CopG family [Candidatus Paceibacterota bacterium]
MTTLSVPLPAHLEEMVKKMAKQRGSNKAAIVREALERFAEEEAISAVLKAEKEQPLRGDLRVLARKLRS